MPPFVKVNAERAECFALLGADVGAALHGRRRQTIGMPMSLIEALRAGACVVHPDRPELRPTWSVRASGAIATVDDIVAHVREIAAGGPAIEAERQANEAWARAQFCDPAARAPASTRS